MSLLVAAADEPASVDAASVAATVLAGAELAGAAELAGVDALPQAVKLATIAPVKRTDKMPLFIDLIPLSSLSFFFVPKSI